MLIKLFCACQTLNNIFYWLTWFCSIKSLNFNFYVTQPRNGWWAGYIRQREKNLHGYESACLRMRMNLRIWSRQAWCQVSSLNCIDMDGFAKLEGKLRFSFFPITKCWITSSVGLFYAMNVVWHALHCCLLHFEWVSMWRILFQMNLAFCERWTLCNILTFQ